MKPEYIEVSSYEKEGYSPVVDYMEWRVAILNYIDELEIENITTMQKHNETDEVFVLLKGNCTLITGGKGDSVEEIDSIKMEPYKLYNVKRGVWHTHTLDKEGSVLIIENRNTCDDNSPILELTKEQREKLFQMCK